MQRTKTDDDQRLLAWALCCALGDLIQEAVDKQIDPAVWKRALLAYDAFLTWAVEEDANEPSDEACDEAVARWWK